MGWWRVDGGKNIQLTNGDDPMDEMAMMVNKLDKILGYPVNNIPIKYRRNILLGNEDKMPAWALRNKNLVSAVRQGWQKIEKFYLKDWDRKPLPTERRAIVSAQLFGFVDQIFSGVVDVQGLKKKKKQNAKNQTT